MIQKGRTVGPARTGDLDLSLFSQLPGTWSNQVPSGSGLPDLTGHGWNMIALPFAPGPLKFRLLLNQFNEKLVFSTVDKAVPNRGIPADQHLLALQYTQDVSEIAAIDEPATPNTPDMPKGPPNTPAAIHHEPGLFLAMGAPTDAHADIARLGTIPHGDAVLAMGTGTTAAGGPIIPTAQDHPSMGLPDGVPHTDATYLKAYTDFHAHPFLGLFDPTRPTDLLIGANQGVAFASTTTLHFSTAIPTGGIHNIPFVNRQAKAVAMDATFWIEQLDDKDASGDPIMRLQYLQIVLLEFFKRTDGKPGLIRWPHISINTMVRIARS